MITGLSHMTFIVRDLARTARLLCEVLDAREVYSSDGRRFSLTEEKFFMIGDVWLCIMQGEPPAERSYSHVAFKVEPDAFDEYAGRIAAAGVTIRPERPRVEGEGRSIYFYDYDNHLFELHTGTLPERLARYAERP